jgi:uncharacterized repeat protein (TIGR01451 family)
MKISTQKSHLKRSSKALKMAVLHTAALSLAFALQASAAWADITNTAQASGNYNASSVLSNFSSAAVPVVTQNLSLLVSKVPSQTLNVLAGQVITYTYTVKNNGNVTIHNITLSDVHNASGAAPIPGSEILSLDVPPLSDSSDATSTDAIWDSLAPGDTIQFTATYTVKQADVDNLQ